MKALVTLEGLLLLLSSWMWMCSGQKPVLVECSYANFRAVAKRALFYEGELVDPDELFLGTGCVANRVRPDELEFNYPVSFCGIVPQIFFDGSVFHSWLTYKPRNRAISAEFHLQCMVPSTHARPYDIQVSQIHSRLVMLPPIQHWFLVQYRVCGCCGHVHLRDNWSTPFYGTHHQSLQRPFHSSPDLLNFRSFCSWMFSNSTN